MFRYRALAVAVAAAVASTAAPAPALAADDVPWAAPPLERVISVRDGRTGDDLSLDALLDVAATADVVFLGETHTDEATHRVELAVLDGLLARRDGRVVLAMEMFERDVQDDLDAYLAGEIDEPTFLSRARPWRNYRTAYRRLVERAREAGAPVVASNFPRPLLRRVAMEGAAALESLEGDERRHAPRELFPNTEAYWERVDNAIRSHRGMFGGGGPEQRLYSTQSLWDNAMGESCADALDGHPGHLVLHVNGVFHSEFWDGAVHQLRQRNPDAGIVTIGVSPSANPAAAEVRGRPSADYVIFTEARAFDPADGAYSVRVTRKQEYRLHLPEAAGDDGPVPLLVWLGDDGLTASDGLDLWRDRLGDEAAIAVVEAPYREVLPDLAEGGRWFWADSFPSDIDTLATAVERAWAYLLRNHPIDPDRVCLAGEGTGATVVAATALLTGRAAVDAVAFGPRRYAKIRDFPLPLPAYRGDEPAPDVTLRVVAGAGDAEWWAQELEEYRGVGLDAGLEGPSGDPYARELAQENAVRAALGLEARPAPSTGDRRAVVLEEDSPRALHWGRLLALRSLDEDGVPAAVVTSPPEDGSVARLPIEIRPEAFAADGMLPRCPGPFGGTTVLVLPDGTPPVDARDWLALEENDPLNRDSRFHRLRIATERGEGDLASTLAALKEAGRENVLVVPAVFCADAGFMQSLKRRVRDLEDQMTIQWLPGLGGREIPLPSASSAAAAEHEPPVHHELEVVLDPDARRIAVRDRVALPPSLRRAGAEFALSAAISIRSSSPPVQMTAMSDDGEARYALQSAPADGILEIAYAGTFDQGLSDQREEYTRGFRETSGIVGPEGIYLAAESRWIPTFDDRLIRFDVTVRQPEGWHVISQGSGTSSDADGRARWSADGLMEQVHLVGGPLVVERDSAGAVETLVYLHERDDGLARKYLDATAQYLEMYRELIGPYPYGKFALVENFWETGYGMPSFTLLGPQIIRFPFILTSSYPHEILHNWWGNSVFVEDGTGNWCEGLTAYMADHLIQEQRGAGDAYRRTTLQKYRDYVREGRDFPLSEFRSRHSAATEAVGYGKSLMLFHMLRRRVGDDDFRAALAAFYRRFRGERASFADLRSAFESTSGEDLSGFFAQWVDRAGAPSLALRDVRGRRAAGGFTVTGSIEQVQEGEPYELAVPVRVMTEDGPAWFDVETASRSEPFELTTASRPLALAADPMFDLFRLLDPRETPSSISQIFGDPKALAVLPAAAGSREEQERYRSLMKTWRTESHEIEVVSDVEIDSLPDDRAVWILGRRNRFAPRLHGPGADPADGGAALRLADETVPFDDHCFVVIRRHPGNVSKAVGWLVVDPGEATDGMGRKLPHYGKYSYLAFEGDEPTNIVKGQWDATGSPLVVDLRDDRSQPMPTAPAEARPPLAELPPVFSRRGLMEHVEWLAAPEREGRGLGSAGLAASAGYIAERFEAAGLEPGGDGGSWFQRFTVPEGPEGRPVEAANVVGILRGTRDDWSDQSVVLCAHYDHLGYGWPDVRAGQEGALHPGADDNASGVAVLLELAANLVEEGGRSRTLVVLACSAEECGRHGSKHFVANPPLPASGIRGVINLDTVGRLGDGEIAVHGTGTADEWPHIFRGCGFVTGVRSRNVPTMEDGSDQLSFIEAGVPAVQLFTGAHGDYHRPSDTVDGVDGAGLVQVATFTKEAIAYLLERDEPLTVRIEGSAAPARPAAGGGRRVMFGTVPDFGFAGPGVRIDSLVPGSPAERAGLRAGDVLVRLGDEVVEDLRGFSAILKGMEAGQEVEATFVREGRRSTVTVVVEAR